MATDLKQLRAQMDELYDKYSSQATDAKEAGDNMGIAKAQSSFTSEVNDLVMPILDNCPPDMYSDEMPEHKLWMEFLLEIEVKGGLIGA